MSNKLEHEQLVPGAIVMVGPSINRDGTKDLSWTDAIWRIEAITGRNVLCKRMSRLIGYGDVIFMRADDHAWFAAEHVLDAYNKAKAEAEEEYRREREVVRAMAQRKKTSGLATVIAS